MRGTVKIDDGACVHVIPRAEVRYAEVVAIDQGYDPAVTREYEAWELRYQLTGADTRSVQWRGDCRPPSLRNDKISVGEYNRIAAEAVLATITRGYSDFHLERRSDGVMLVRAGFAEDDAHVVTCRKFIAEMALTARQTAIGPLDETRRHMLHEIHAAARDLVLPAWYPLQFDAPPASETTGGRTVDKKAEE
ncbi:MAG TPA: hypothetical protein VLE97_08925 [Gaiellaceae bacterium]|nr:hypothetical protein [Gaiellaceae bacterium]